MGFFKAKVTQTSSQLNRDRDKIFTVFWTITIKSEFLVKLILSNNLGLERKII